MYTVFSAVLTGASAYPVEASTPPMNICTLSCRITFLALVTPVSGLACSSSTMNFTGAPLKLLLTSSRYIWKPLTMSVPTWANAPVIGARKPMRSSSAPAGVVAPVPSAQPTPNSIVPKPRSRVLVMVSPPLLYSSRSRRRQARRVARLGAALADQAWNAHQAVRQIEDREHVDRTQGVLPPRHDGAEIFAQRDHDHGAERAADQAAGTAEHDHQEGCDRRGQPDRLRADHA